MTARRACSRFAAVLLVTAASTAGLVGAVAAATPPETGCPAAYAQLSVTWLESQGPYQLPRQLDEAGNQDGLVCGRALEDHAAASYCGGPCEVQVYDFSDNSRTPSYR
jgi:hypothetical protein